MILIVEDDREWEDYYRQVFGGFEVECCHDGVAAMQRMDEAVPDVVILDILLTGPTGFAVLNEMQSYPELAQVPVAVVSSVAVPDGVLEKYGVKAVFDKGEMRPDELRECVQSLAELG